MKYFSSLLIGVFFLSICYVVIFPSELEAGPARCCITGKQPCNEACNKVIKQLKISSLTFPKTKLQSSKKLVEPVACVTPCAIKVKCGIAYGCRNSKTGKCIIESEPAC